MRRLEGGLDLGVVQGSRRGPTAMHEIPILREILVVLLASVAVVFLFSKLRLPPIVGFLLAGLLIGPDGLGLLADRDDIEVVAEIGVVLLLFGIGLEVSLSDLARLRSIVFGGGLTQFVLTMGPAAGVLYLLGIEPRSSVFIGTLVALSSTAIVLKLLADRNETGSVHGRGMLGILIFQDLAFVPLMLLVPFLEGTGSWTGLVAVILKALVVIGLMLAAARFLFPWLMERVVRTRNRELFTLSTIVVALGTAYAGGLAGLSLPLGAFIAGMVLSESEYSDQVLSEIAPLRDSFNSLFFVSIGMLMDPRVVLAEPAVVGLLVIGVISLKVLVSGLVVLLLGYTLRVALLVGFGLAQVGEFSFVLAQEGVRHGVVGDREQSLFLAVSVLTMLLTPAAMAVSRRLARIEETLARLGLRFVLRPRVRDEDIEPSLRGASDHVIIVGYGVNGRNVGRVLRKLEVKYHIVELNPHTVRSAREGGEAISYGDATRQIVLEHLGIARARAVVVAIADPAAARQIVANARKLNPNAFIAVRTRLEAEVEALRELGADEVIPEEFETSLALAGAVMATYGATAHAIEREKSAIRRERYQLLRARGIEHGAPKDEVLATLSEVLESVDVEMCRLGTKHEAVGKSLREVDLRARTGASVIAVERTGRVLANPRPDLVLEPGDQLVVVGKPEEIDAATEYLEREAEAV